MRATYMYGAGDVRVIDIPDPAIKHPADALVRVVRSCICGSDLHPYHSMPVTPEGASMGTSASASWQTPVATSPLSRRATW
jgi:threonine dehydrogenase-like Zn-dependent dehydrogenase